MRIKTLPPAWVSGFLEAAGSFTFNRGGDQLTLVFAVRLRQRNRRLLEELQRFFGGIGRIYETSARDGRAPTRNSCFFRVNRPPELLRIVEHFERHPLRGERRHRFAIWREMVLLRAAHARSRPPPDLQALADELSSRRRSG